MMRPRSPACFIAAVPFFPRFPLVFYIGLLPVICILWLWADSARTMTMWGRSMTPTGCDTVMAAQWAITIRHDELVPSQPGQAAPLRGMLGWGGSSRWGDWSRSKFQDRSPLARPWLFPAYIESSQTNRFSKDRNLRTDSISVPFWLILLCYLPPWLLVSWWQASRREKKRKADAAAMGNVEPPVPLPPSVLGTFARRLPLLFYVGILPVLLLCWLWAASRTDLMEWHRTRSWVHDHGVIAAESLLHFQHQWIAGDLPTDVESYPWHQQWEEDGRSLAFECRANWFKGTASLFPAPGRSQVEQKKEYLTVSVSKVSLPVWLILLCYLPLWLGISWGWARWRKRTRSGNGGNAVEPRMNTDKRQG